MIRWVGAATQQSLLDGAVYKFYRAVVLQQHARSHISDGRIKLARHSIDTLQQLVLLMTEPAVFSNSMAELKKLAKLETKFGQLAELLNTDRRVSGRGSFPLNAALSLRGNNGSRSRGARLVCLRVRS